MSDQPTTPPTPDEVVPGQMWRDNDQRTKGAGEFTVLAVAPVVGPARIAPDLPSGLAAKVEARVAGIVESFASCPDGDAIVQRKGGRLTRIRCDRLLSGGNTQRGYTYLGMSR